MQPGRNHNRETNYFSSHNPKPAAVLLRRRFISGDKPKCTGCGLIRPTTKPPHPTSSNAFESRSALPNPISPPNRALVFVPTEQQFKNHRDFEACTETSRCTDLLRQTLLYQLSEAESYSDDKQSLWPFDEDGFLRLRYLCRVFGQPKIQLIGGYDSDALLNRADKERFHYEYQGGSDDLQLLWSEKGLPGFLDLQETADDEGYAADKGSGDCNEAKQDDVLKKDEKRIRIRRHSVWWIQRMMLEKPGPVRADCRELMGSQTIPETAEDVVGIAKRNKTKSNLVAEDDLS